MKYTSKHPDLSLANFPSVTRTLALSLSFYNFLALCLLCCYGNKPCGGCDAAHITPVSLSSPEERGSEGDRDKWVTGFGVGCVFAGVGGGYTSANFGCHPVAGRHSS